MRINTLGEVPEAGMSKLKLSEAELSLCVSDHFSESHETKEGLKRSQGKQKITSEKSLHQFNDNVYK